MSEQPAKSKPSGASGNGQAIDRRTVAEWLRVFIGPKQVAELRCPDAGRYRTVSGYFDNLDLMAEAALEWSGKAAAVYFTINPCQPDLLARRVNRAEAYAKETTSDAGILCRRWFFLDFDPCRPSGISSTDAEHAAALERAEQCRDWLGADGWPSPVEADSSNGGHLHYAIDLPNDEHSLRLLEQCLKALAFRFSDARVEVDVKTGNAARICKLYGTRSCKGDSTPDRPHRLARVLVVPRPLVKVPRDLLEALAASTPDEPAELERKGRTFAMKASGFDLGRWIEEHNLPVVCSGDWKDGKKWVLNPCPWNEEHTNRAAFIVQFGNGKIAAGCHHNGCDSKDWHALRDVVEPGWRERRAAWDQARGGGGRNGAAAPAAPSWEDPLPFAEYARPEFPVDCLPPWLGDFVNALAESTQTPPDLAAMLTLALAGAGLAGKFRVKVRSSWTEPTNIFSATALPVGNRKSAVYAEVFAPVQEVEQEAVRHTEPRIAEAASKKRILENRLKGLEAKAAKEADETERRLLTHLAQQAAKELAETHVPALPEFFGDDATPEKVAGLLAEQGGRLLVASAEGTIFDIIKGRYSDVPNFDVFLKGHSGDPVRVHRVGRETEYVERPALSLAVAVQPDVIKGLATETTLRGRGLLGRILYSVPPSTVGRRKTRPEPLPEAIAARYRANMLTLWRLDGGNDGPHLLELDAEADRLIEALESRLEPRLGSGGDLESVADWACKLAGAAARLAGILHVADAISGRGTWQPTVTRQSAEAAVSIGEDYLLPHARAALGLMGADERLEDAQRVVAWLRKQLSESLKSLKGYLVLKKSSIHSGVFGGSRSVEEFGAVLQLLVEMGYLRSVQADEGERGPGRKPSPGYEVNPALASQEEVSA